MSGITLVTQSGMTKSQPGVCVSYTLPHYGDRMVTLHVTRSYDRLPNEFGGHGVTKHLDGDGLRFSAYEEASAYAADRGYLQAYFTSPDLRARKVAEGFNPKTRMYEGPNPPRWWVERGRQPLSGPKF